MSREYLSHRALASYLLTDLPGLAMPALDRADVLNASAILFKP